jgi:hypothetical protein
VSESTFSPINRRQPGTSVSTDAPTNHQHAISLLWLNGVNWGNANGLMGLGVLFSVELGFNRGSVLRCGGFLFPFCFSTSLLLWLAQERLRYTFDYIFTAFIICLLSFDLGSCVVGKY